MTDCQFEDLLDIKSNFLELTPVTRDDVPLIFELRTTEEKNFLRPTSGDISDQYAYYENYLKRFHDQSEIYYRIFDIAQGQYCGVVRLTEINQTPNFNWQSLVIRAGCSPQIGIDIMLVIYSIGFDLLNREYCGPWPVSREFSAIFRIHDFIGMTEVTSEDEEYINMRVVRSRFYEKIEGLRRRGFGELKNVNI